MSINWVMLSPNTDPPFTPLPDERVLRTSPKRIGLSVQSPTHYPARQQEPFSLTHANGVLYLTNQRIIYLPDKPTERLKSFASMILKIHDSHVTYPLFGSNSWIASCQPVQGGGIPIPSTGVVELKFTFKEGGVFDFHQMYEQVRERLLHAVEVSRLSGGGLESSQEGMSGFNMSSVNLEELPAYSEQSDGPLLPPTVAAAQAQQQSSPASQLPRDSAVGVEEERPQPKPSDNTFGPPTEPPPGYEETQMANVQNEAERLAARER